jgi:hypothetical protein
MMHPSALTFQANSFPQPPTIALDNFRAARLHNRVSTLTPKANQFESAVHAFADGHADLPQVIREFQSTIKGFADTARAASRAGLLSADTRQAVDMALEGLVEEFQESFQQVNRSLQDLEDANPVEAAEFLLEARERMDRMADFWRKAVSAVARPGASPTPRM